MRAGRIGLAVIVALLLVLGIQHAPDIRLSTSVPSGHEAVQVQAVVDRGTTAGALILSRTSDHLEHERCRALWQWRAYPRHRIEARTQARLEHRLPPPNERGDELPHATTAPMTPTCACPS